jgi:methyltransferase-like protein/SAM-dependent methyltransferase
MEDRPMSMTLDQSPPSDAEQNPLQPSIFGNARIQCNAYDEVPYRSYPYAQSHPARLATVATLLGLRPAAVAKCRVLELGCCTGGNIIPMAEQLPEAQFTGVDFSARQISDGCGAIQQAGLSNVRLLHKDILEIDAEFGEFDYIIAHGVYSWVPPQVQAKILQICKQNLSPNGVAYVSYNTLPGWRMRGIIRDIMLYRARNLPNPSERLNRSRELINFLAESVSEENNPYGVLLRKELELLNCKNDQYLLHDHLEVHNEAVYFSEFASRAQAVGLQYLGEAEFGAMCSRNLPQQVQAVLSAISSDVIETEQYMDFLRNRTFRQTLLVHAGQRIDRQVQPQRLLKMFVASPMKPETPVTEVNNNETVKFCGKSAVTKTRDPLMKATLLQLSELWPTSVEVSQVIGTTLTKLREQPAFIDPDVLTADSNRVAEPLIRCFETGQVELSVIPSNFVTTVSERPCVAAYTRIQAKSSNHVTSLRHTTVELSDLQRHVAQHLDGTRSVEQVKDLLVELAQQGKIVVHHQGKPVRDPSIARELIDEPVNAALRQLAKFVLLVS